LAASVRSNSNLYNLFLNSSLNLLFFKFPGFPPCTTLGTGPAFAGMTALFLHYDTVSMGGGKGE
jgi:hypothetical protein